MLWLWCFRSWRRLELEGRNSETTKLTWEGRHPACCFVKTTLSRSGQDALRSQALCGFRHRRFLICWTMNW
jgi:hypothetical protein